MKNRDTIHPQASGEAMWAGKYTSPLSTAQFHYEAARGVYHSTVQSPEDRSLFHMGVVKIYQSHELMTAEKDFVEKAMTLSSTLFSAINSLPGLIPWKKETMLCRLRVVVGELYVCNPELLTSPYKEVLIACYMMLEKELSGLHANKVYYSAVAKKLLHEVLKDQTASLVTRMLATARGASMTSLSDKERRMYVLVVMDLLEQIHDNPATISSLGQEWKTYVRLARMIYAWRYMFFGLRFDKSKDLHIKSYLFFAANFYKI